ncbi:hypothetical protein HYX11_04975 [Candidatus Woesearchaeota archaeon]|nr:hypothetical protein [Candidatus Woesearchaeota archaeon]
MEYKKCALEFAKGTLVCIAAGTIGWVAYNGLWRETLEDVVVTSIGICDVYFVHEGKVVSEQSPKMTITNYEGCLRGYEIRNKNITVGDKIKEISFRSPLVGDCKVISDLVKED